MISMPPEIASTLILVDILSVSQTYVIIQVQFYDLGSSQSTLDSARTKVKEVAGKMWSGYLALEKKGQAGTKEIVNISVSTFVIYNSLVLTYIKRW